MEATTPELGVLFASGVQNPVPSAVATQWRPLIKKNAKIRWCRSCLLIRRSCKKLSKSTAECKQVRAPNFLFSMIK